MKKILLSGLREPGLLKAGERVGVAVSGGADSVALLRALHELRKELGIVLSVVHFHHGIRGLEADQDEIFVAELATRLGLECTIGRGDVPTHAKTSAQSVETAARDLRYRFFESVLRSGTADRIATAHTMDDQAETVLMRTLRGAGTRGLAGIHAEQAAARYVRPLLGIRRSAIEEYLRSVGQEWREDATNAERKHFRNQVRHDLLPLLARDFNPNIVEVLARTAEISAAEEAYWAQETAQLLPLIVLPGKPARGGGRKSSPPDATLAISLEKLSKYPLGVRRRLVLAAMRGRGIEADFEHVEAVLGLAAPRGGTTILPGGWKASRSFRELRLEPPTKAEGGVEGYAHQLAVPGEAKLEAMKLLVRAHLEDVASEGEGYNRGEVPGELHLEEGVCGNLVLRNWQSGDRLWPAHSKGETKVKEILQKLRIPADRRPLWPVVLAGDSLIWVHGARQRPVRIRSGDKEHRLIIEARELS